MKLFNNKRKKTMPEKGLKKYMLYAFGEILLVVIGILIAVSINNWNEGRKLKSMQIDLAHKVNEQMVLDTLNFSKLMAYNTRIKKFFDLALRDTKPNEELNCLNCLGLVSGNMYIANMDPKIKHLLRDAQLGDDDLSKALRKIQEAYEDNSVILSVLEESMINNLKSNMDYLQKFEWFAPAIANNNCNEDCLKYIALNFDFRNRLAYTELLTLKAYDREVRSFQKEITAFIKNLDLALSDQN